MRELLGLKCNDIDLQYPEIQRDSRSIVFQVVGPCKTEASLKLTVRLDRRLKPEALVYMRRRYTGGMVGRHMTGVRQPGCAWAKTGVLGAAPHTGTIIRPAATKGRHHTAHRDGTPAHVIIAPGKQNRYQGELRELLPLRLQPDALDTYTKPSTVQKQRAQSFVATGRLQRLLVETGLLGVFLIVPARNGAIVGSTPSMKMHSR